MHICRNLPPQGVSCGFLCGERTPWIEQIETSQWKVIAHYLSRLPPRALRRLPHHASILQTHSNSLFALISSAFCGKSSISGTKESADNATSSSNQNLCFFARSKLWWTLLDPAHMKFRSHTPCSRTKILTSKHDQEKQEALHTKLAQQNTVFLITTTLS